MANPTPPTITTGPGGATNTLVTLRPANSDISNGGSGSHVSSWSPFGTSTLIGATSDDSVNTFISPTFVASSGTTLVLASVGLPTMTLPALAQVRYVQMRSEVGMVPGNTPGTYLYTQLSNQYTDQTVFGGSVVPPSSATFLSAPAGTALVGGGVIDQAFLTSVQMDIQAAVLPGMTCSVWELYADVWYNQAPVVTAVAPSGTVTTTSRPTLSHTYTDPEGDVQERYKRKVFLKPATGWPSDLNPDTGHYTGDGGVALKPVVDFLEQFSPTTDNASTRNLINGVYRHYVAASDTGSNGRYGAWSYLEWTQNVPAPNAPQVRAIPDPAHMAIDVNMLPATTGPATTYFELQRSDDGGITWTTVVDGDRITGG